MMATLAFGLALGAAVAAPLVWRIARRSAQRERGRALEAEERVRESERMAYVGQLAGGLAHEIKNPLNALSVNLQLLMEDWNGAAPDPAPKVARRIETLQHETERLAGVLDDFLRFVRGYDMDLAETDLKDMLDETLDFFAPEAEQNGVALRRVLEDIPPLHLDARLLKQAVFNLLVNARQAMPEGGEIFVQASCRNGEAMVHVTDTGTGIPPEEMESIFRPYFSTKAGGTGLGLPTARRIIEEHGGSVRVQSEPGKGSRFTIALPTKPQGNP